MRTIIIFSVLWILQSVATKDVFFANEVVNPYQEYSYVQVKKDLEKLQQIYPKHVFLTSIGESTFGRELLAVKIGHGEKAILITGAHHGREWLTCNLIMKMLEEYIKAYEVRAVYDGIDTAILDEIAIWFVPMVNPDGVTIQQRGIEEEPIALKQLLLQLNGNDTNFKKWKANGIGIDLNRQYPAGWDELKGTSSTASFQYFKGNKPLEAPEVQALVKFTYKIDPLISLAYHSSGRVLYWSYKNNAKVIRRDYELAKKISTTTGYRLAQPPKTAVGGGYTDWFIQEFKRPGMTAEISFPVKNTSPPLKVFKEEWSRNKTIGLLLAIEAEKLYKQGLIK
ncbi:carboxypeptidase [Bacillus timonensis]|nr:carboxypeptidase [Bacillus timonensis]